MILAGFRCDGPTRIPMGRFTQNLVVALFGAVTSIITAAILVFVELRFGWALYSYTLWFVIPAGAICAGLVASSGYYFGSRLLNFRPTRNLLLAIVAISGGVFFLIYWLEYVLLTVNGKSISEVVSLGQFLNYSLSHTAIRFGLRGHPIGDAVDIGSGGYLYAALQIMGFAIGGLAVYGHLISLPFCGDCKLYLSKKGYQKRYFENPEDMQNSVAAFLAKVRDNQLQQSIQVHAETGSTAINAANVFSSFIEIKRCKACEKHWLKFTAQRKAGDDWKDISDLGYATFCMERVDVMENLSPSHKGQI